MSQLTYLSEHKTTSFSYLLSTSMKFESIRFTFKARFTYALLLNYCRYVDFLCRMNDDRNVRVLFERALSVLPPEESAEVCLLCIFILHWFKLNTLCSLLRHNSRVYWNSLTSFKIIVELHMFYSNYVRVSWKVDSGALNFPLLVFHFGHMQLCKCFFVVSKFVVHCSHNDVQFLCS